MPGIIMEEVATQPTPPANQVNFYPKADGFLYWIDDTGVEKSLGTGYTLIQSQTAANSTAIDFVSGITSSYDEYLISLSNVTPATNGTNMSVQVSENAGGAWKSGASDYEVGRAVWGSVTTITTAQGVNSASIPIAAGLSNSDGAAGDFRFFSPSITGKKKILQATITYYSSGNEVITSDMGGVFKGTTNAINGIRFIMSSGNISTGIFSMYGLRKP